METQSLQTTDPASLVPMDVSAAALQSALAGDLSRLPEPERLKFYGALCQFTGLNPLAKPFDWLTFQGKLTLYANKGCAEQLRKLHRVSVDIIERKVEFGCLIVRVKATDGNGRHDESLAAVPFNEKGPADAVANAMMKCESKAKRRVTLSICGLSMMLEREEGHVTNGAPGNIVTDTETVHDRVQKLNAALTGAQKADAVDVETIPENRAPEALATSETGGSNPPGSHPLPAEPSIQAPPAPPQEPAPLLAQANSPATAAVLTDDEVRQMETALAANPQPKRALEYLIYRGWLEKGKGLDSIKRDAFRNIISKPQSFARMVESWKGAL